MSVESADENFERKRNEMKTMVGLEIAKTQKTLGFPGQAKSTPLLSHRSFEAMLKKKPTFVLKLVDELSTEKLAR